VRVLGKEQRFETAILGGACQLVGSDRFVRRKDRQRIFHVTSACGSRRSDEIATAALDRSVTPLPLVASSSPLSTLLFQRVSFLYRIRCGWSASAPNRFLRSAS